MQTRMRGGDRASEQTAVAVSPARSRSYAVAMTVTPPASRRIALQNFEAIIGTPGIDGFFLGPSDLSIALSEGKNVDPLSKEVDTHLDTMIAGAQKAKKIPGAYCHSAERAAALAKRGVKFLAVSSDLAMLRAGAATALKTLKG